MPKTFSIVEQFKNFSYISVRDFVATFACFLPMIHNKFKIVLSFIIYAVLYKKFFGCSFNDFIPPDNYISISPSGGV